MGDSMKKYEEKANEKNVKLPVSGIIPSKTISSALENQVFYVKVTPSEYTKLIFLLKETGLDFVNYIDAVYPVILVNNSSEKVGDLPSKSFWGAHVSRGDRNTVYQYEEFLDLFGTPIREQKKLEIDSKILLYPPTPDECYTKKEVLKAQKFSSDKAPIYTFCKQFTEAMEALALRSLYGHIKYIETDKDWKNFERIENPDYEYGNASFRHALGIGDDEDEKEHYIATAWNAIARLQTYLKERHD